ncbi:MAG TPA: FG-GAP-like repeat-containing protein [Terriglobales bacterium]|nr:FG-GAP-like repeat-containing protein [Terriglobales bacterium]
MSPKHIFSLTLVGYLLVATGCSSKPKLPEKGTPVYNDAVSSFYIGLAALQVGHDIYAEDKLSQFTKMVPNEPAGWANWGVLALRQRNYDLASQRFSKARELASKNDQIYYLMGILEGQRGNSAAAIDDLREAVDLNSQNLRAAYQLAQEVERQGGEKSEAESESVIQKILASQPDNLAALLELGRAAAKRKEAGTLKSVVAKISARSSAWPSEVQQQVAALQTATNNGDMHAAATRTTFLRNVLMRVYEYRQSLAVIKAPPGEEAQPFTHFLAMESPVFKPAAADTALSFSTEPVANLGKGWSWIGAIPLGSIGAPVVAVANGQQLRFSNGAAIAFPGGTSHTAPLPESVTPADLNYDFKNDLILTGASGVRLFRQENPNQFTDVTAKSKLPKSVVNGNYTGAWAVDIEADGDLDIVLGAKTGELTVLRNNGDDTFTPIHPFKGISGLQQFVWADLDGDGDPDAALIDGSGKLHVFANERLGQFRERALPTNFPTVKAIATADVNNDSVMDLLVVESSGSIVRLTDKNEESWDVAEVAQVPDAASNLANDVRLRVADLDNNGGLDLILDPVGGKNTNGAFIWLKDDKGNFVALDHPSGSPLVFDSADTNGDGHLKLLGLTVDGEPMQAINHGTKNYHWQTVRPHGVQSVGDQRINPFGVGGEIEIRSGLLVQKQTITGPQMHFGLGEQTSSDVVRVVWPNGTVRAEFAAKSDQDVTIEQRLKASCPFLFAFNGKEMEFVKDAVPWGAAIGLRINTLGAARVATTVEWYKIGRDQLVPHDRYYDVRIGAELWETYYYDNIALMTVDHPIGTEIFVDERFVVPPQKPQFTVVETPRNIARATDDFGNDVTDILTTLDGRALENFGKGQYQGVTRDHYVEIDLGNDVPDQGPLYMIGQGSIHDTDSSINVAITQGHRWQAKGMSLEVPDGKGGWILAQDNLGFPAGRKKTVVFNLTDIFHPGTPKKVRIHTNLEIFWDRISWAKGMPDASVKTTRMLPSYADLHYRGYSVIHRPDSGAPEVPDYNHLEGSKQRWRDLIGYYTRYGDVKELLEKVDDRYVIVNSGDEMSLRFDEQPAPQSGYLRDFVITGDGWIKDGDYNSTFSKTVLPLPYHGKDVYDLSNTKPGRLEDEWAYRQHPEDWQNYHTRYITPDVFQNSLRRDAQK